MSPDASGLFSPQTFEKVCQPIDSASTMPPRIYTSPQWYEQEVETIFMRSWLLATREEEIPNPGDYVRLDFVGEPIIVVRDKTGEIHALSATCRHRGAELVTGQGNTRTFTCPYHGWTYALDGQLLSARAMENAVGFDKKLCRLPSIRAETWGGFVFVNFDDDAPSLMSSLGDLPERFKSYRFEDMRVTRKWHNLMNCNWKVFVENSREGYHVPFAHRGSVDTFYPGCKVMPFTAQGKPDVYEINSSNNENGLYIPRNPTLPFIEGLSQEDRESTHFLIFYPHLLLNLPPDRITFHQYFPEGPERTRLVTWCCFPKETVERPDFEQKVPDYYAPMDMFIREDCEICEVVQRGIRSRFATAGRFSPQQERTVYQFDRYVLNRMFGTAGA